MTDSSSLMEKSWMKIAYWLSIFTILYNISEGIISVLFGWTDESLTLFGFGMDSFIETISAIGVWHMLRRMRENPLVKRDKFERLALRITGYSFFGLVFTLLLGSIFSLTNKKGPESGFAGVIISLISIGFMRLLIALKLRAGKILKSEAILADANCAKVCVMMSVILLLSSALDEGLNLPYTDVVGSLGLAWFSFREGRECFEKANSDKLCSCEH